MTLVVTAGASLWRTRGEETVAGAVDADDTPGSDWKQ